MQRRPSQRRPSPDQAPAPRPAQAPVRTRSTAPEGLENRLLNDASKESDSQEQEQEHVQEQTQTQTQTQTPAPEDDPSVKKCWICFFDSTEDTPESSPWRDPCPCALVAHEECLLDWIADTEAPKNTGRGSLVPPQILCPQCKAEIKLARPRDYVVDIVRAFDRLTARMVMPGGVVVLSVDLLYKISFAHGVHSIYRIFGSADADRILLPVMLNWARPPIDFDLPVQHIRDKMLASLAHYVHHWRLYLGLPLITPMLLLSRTNWGFSEPIMTVLPTLFFALQPSWPEEGFDLVLWPPSASMAFALLPYARRAYNLYYERVWGAKERRWMKEIQPNHGQGQNDAAGDADQAQPVDEVVDENNDIFEVRIDGGIWEDWEEGAPQQQGHPDNGPAAAAQAADEVQHEGERAAQEGDQAAPAPNIPDNRANQRAQVNGEPGNQQQRQVLQADRRLSFSPAAVAENVLGALAFTTIAELSGEVLKLALPESWTSLPAAAASAAGGRAGVRFGARGILQEKWGRSLIGGCLFVVLKDALMLYVRWKMAQTHRNRRVLDFDRSRSRARR